MKNLLLATLLASLPLFAQNTQGVLASKIGLGSNRNSLVQSEKADIQKQTSQVNPQIKSTGMAKFFSRTQKKSEPTVVVAHKLTLKKHVLLNSTLDRLLKRRTLLHLKGVNLQQAQPTEARLDYLKRSIHLFA